MVTTEASEFGMALARRRTPLTYHFRHTGEDHRGHQVQDPRGQSAEACGQIRPRPFVPE